MKSFSMTRGFTLLEILVSLSIIGVLLSILYVSFGDARQSSQNRALMAEVKEVQLALELYKAQNGSYPAGGTYPAAPANDIVPSFIAEVPDQTIDSPNAACDITYSTAADNSWYKLTADQCLGGNIVMTQNDEMAQCPSSCANCPNGPATAAFGKSFAVYSLGGQCQ